MATDYILVSGIRAENNNKGVTHMATDYFPKKMRQFDAVVTYEPFVSDDGRVGYRVRDKRTNQQTYIYLNPSDTDDVDDDTPNVFVYMGTSNDPVNDNPLHFYEIEYGEAEEQE